MSKVAKPLIWDARVSAMELPALEMDEIAGGVSTLKDTACSDGGGGAAIDDWWTVNDTYYC